MKIIIIFFFFGGGGGSGRAGGGASGWKVRVNVNGEMKFLCIRKNKKWGEGVGRGVRSGVGEDVEGLGG